MTDHTTAPAAFLPPGSVIGILGGGQLGRMTALAAAQLGYDVHVYCGSEDEPAAQVARFVTTASFDDEAALARFAEAVNVVTYEFENIPTAPVRFLEERVAVRPGAAVLETGQDRIKEKAFFNGLDVATAPWKPVHSLADLEAAVEALGRPSVLKTARLGYDGKGQVRIDHGTDLAEAWDSLKTDAAVLEGFIDFDREISVIVARGTDGAIACYDPVENIHVHHILDTTIAPAPVDGPRGRQTLEDAVSVAKKAADALELVGLLAVEMFVDRSGHVLVNEMAPRPHNSGHWTMDACLTSQFEQLVRAICGLPLGSPLRRCDCRMKNLIGEDVHQWQGALSETTAHVHLYGKAEVRAGRKMGHINYLYPLSEDGHHG
ncbi:5-(carboxyamino)imidazole ribonucleotide synthase [Caenispirillum salinarum]|uniref:5-(carboxyamino)imidazole ribonucleotide synthase n=1 Tax=Caenispirillum salinarum TaxID=859058 RepID=UPI003850922D